ncbi:MAG: nuclear transport factor 2 family protein [Calothrix sp. MO_167.B42]|nr:nuclear transport factor 2 family protein [Calothrix sp. MO_167.B42]
MSKIDDINAIRDIAKLYFDGTHYSDGDKMEQAFAPGCQIIGKTMRAERDDWIASIRKRKSPHSQNAPYDYGIQSIEIDGDIALARLLTPINGMLFTDIMTLLKGDDGRWQVVAKAFYKHPQN